MAVSRPEPGPLTKTSTRFMPCSMARRPAASAAIWAANGVDLREPLKPTWPAEAQLMTAPVSANLVARSASRSGLVEEQDLIVNHLAEDLKEAGYTRPGD